MFKPNETSVPNLKWENTDEAVGKHNFTFRGTDFQNWSAQVELTNASLKIYSSNKKQPGRAGWTDMTSSFSMSAINSDRTLVQNSEIKVLWWKIEVTTSNATNKFNLYINRYNKKQG